MSLVNWSRLDKEYLELKTLLLAKKVPQTKVEAATSRLVLTEAQEWDAFLERTKPSMPTVVRELLATLTYADATRMTAVNKFGASVAELWPDIQEEVKRLQNDNAKMIEERHKYRTSVLFESMKR